MSCNKSQIQVTKNPCDKIWKICLSVFCDWKVHSQVSHKGSRKTFWVKLATGASTREPVAKLNCENPKNPKFWNFSKSFSRLGAWLARESRKLLSKLATSLTHEEKLHSFWKFWNFSKQKHFSKTIKTLKNLFVFDQHIIKYVQHP